MQILKTNHTYIPFIYLAVGLLALGGLGYLGFLTFVRNILMPGEFATYGLIITTVAAGTASFFSPCSFTVLPSYIAFASSGQDAEPDKRFNNALKNGVAAALGVVTTVAVLGTLIGLLGTGVGADLSITGADPSPVAKALRIGIGAFVLSMGLVHITGQTHRIPFLGKIAVLAMRAEGGGGPSLRSVYAYGAGYVVVGIGCNHGGPHARSFTAGRHLSEPSTQAASLIHQCNPTGGKHPLTFGRYWAHLLHPRRWEIPGYLLSVANGKPSGSLTRLLLAD